MNDSQTDVEFYSFALVNDEEQEQEQEKSGCILSLKLTPEKQESSDNYPLSQSRIEAESPQYISESHFFQTLSQALYSTGQRCSSKYKVPEIPINYQKSQQIYVRPNDTVNVNLIQPQEIEKKLHIKPVCEEISTKLSIPKYNKNIDETKANTAEVFTQLPIKSPYLCENSIQNLRYEKSQLPNSMKLRSELNMENHNKIDNSPLKQQMKAQFQNNNSVQLIKSLSKPNPSIQQSTDQFQNRPNISSTSNFISNQSLSKSQLNPVLSSNILSSNSPKNATSKFASIMNSKSDTNGFQEHHDSQNNKQSNVMEIINMLQNKCKVSNETQEQLTQQEMQRAKQSINSQLDLVKRHPQNSSSSILDKISTTNSSRFDLSLTKLSINKLEEKQSPLEEFQQVKFSKINLVPSNNKSKSSMIEPVRKNQVSITNIKDTQSISSPKNKDFNPKEGFIFKPSTMSSSQSCVTTPRMTFQNANSSQNSVPTIQRIPKITASHNPYSNSNINAISMSLHNEQEYQVNSESNFNNFQKLYQNLISTTTSINLNDKQVQNGGENSIPIEKMQSIMNIHSESVPKLSLNNNGLKIKNTHFSKDVGQITKRKIKTDTSIERKEQTPHFLQKNSPRENSTKNHLISPLKKYTNPLPTTPHPTTMNKVTSTPGGLTSQKVEQKAVAGTIIKRNTTTGSIFHKEKNAKTILSLKVNSILKTEKVYSPRKTTRKYEDSPSSFKQDNITPISARKVN